MIAARALAPYIVALVVGALVSWWGTSTHWQARYNQQQTAHANQLRLTAEANAAVILQQQDDQQVLSGKLSVIDKHYYGELQNARTESRRITDDLATANQRLSVRIDPANCASLPATSGGPGMDDGSGARANLHPTTAEGVFGVVGRADECRVRLSALQDWVDKSLSR